MTEGLDGHKPYIKTYVLYMMGLFFISMLVWFPVLYVSDVVSKLTGISVGSARSMVKVLVTMFVGYFVFRAVIKNDLLKLPSVKRGKKGEPQNQAVDAKD